MKLAVTGLLIFSVLTSAALLLDASVVWFCAALFLTLMSAGATFPISMNMALDLEKTYKGAASAVLGASAFLVGGLSMPLAGLGNILHSTAYVMIASAVITMLLLCIVNKKLCFFINRVTTYHFFCTFADDFSDFSSEFNAPLL